MIKITIDKSSATVAEIQDLETMPSYQELMLKLEHSGGEMGIDLETIESDNKIVSPNTSI